MQELQTIFQQRNKDIESLSSHLRCCRRMQSVSKKLSQLRSQLKEKIKEDNKIINQWMQKQAKLKEQIESFSKKYQYLQKQRLRTQRENWILKIIKSAKNINETNLQFIYQISYRMMSYYLESLPEMSSAILKEPQNQTSKTETIINLFSSFYGIYRTDEFPKVKKIIRPNNVHISIQSVQKFIIFDLLKQLIETHRQFFKVKILQSFKQAPQIKQSNLKNPLPSSQSEEEDTMTLNNVQEEIQAQKNDPAMKFNQKLQGQMRAFLYDYHINVINNMGSPSSLKERVNSLYNQLFEINASRGIVYSINKYHDKCWNFAFQGDKQKANKNLKNNGYDKYDISKLYTQTEIKKIEKKLQTKIGQNKKLINEFAHKFNLTEGKELPPLKEYIKIELENSSHDLKLHQIKTSSIKTTGKESGLQINDWLPMGIRKYIGEFYRMEIYVIYEQQATALQEFQQKYGINFKVHLKNCRKNYEQRRRASNSTKSNDIEQEINIKFFRKHRYFSINMSKTKELLSQEIGSRLFLDLNKKKESIFPMLRNNQIKQAQFQENSLAKRGSKSFNSILKNRSISQQKLIPLFKNQILNQKLQIAIKDTSYNYNTKTEISPKEDKGKYKDSEDQSDSHNSHYQANQLYSIKTNINKIQNGRKNRKIDDIIDSILKQRNLKLG